MKRYPDWWFYFLMVAVSIVVGLVLVSSFNEAPENHDPRLGIVYTDNGYKQCDGTTLVYYKTGVIKDSPECAVTK